MSTAPPQTRKWRVAIAVTSAALSVLASILALCLWGAVSHKSSLPDVLKMADSNSERLAKRQSDGNNNVFVRHKLYLIVVFVGLVLVVLILVAVWYYQRCGQQSHATPNSGIQSMPLPQESESASEESATTSEAEMDGSAHLRWVGRQFVYFRDIPCVDISANDLEESAAKKPHVDHSGPDTSACLQKETSQLVRRLLEGVMDRQVDMEGLLSQDNEKGTVISGNHLARLLVPWARNLLTERGHTHEEHGAKARKALKDVIVSFDHAVDTLPATSTLRFFVQMGVQMGTFLVSISKCAEELWDNDGTSDEHMAYCWYENTKFIKFFHEYLYQVESWLPDIVCIHDGGMPFVSYANQCSPTTVAIRKGPMKPDHLNILHTTASCNCTFVKPSLHDIRKSLLAYKVPTVVFDGTNLTLTESNSPYVAISHVWTDGLGSCTETGFPRCQVERLDRLVRKLVPNGAFWHDGICVPSPTEEKEAWKHAIKLLQSTYTNAHKVLVIDGAIRTQASREMPVEECLLRIATSGWMQRIWTLQEGWLARSLYFEVQNEDIIDTSHFEGKAARMAARLIPTLEYHLSDLPQAQIHRPLCTLNKLIHLLRLRSTSYPEDEPLAIAGLLGIDAEPLSDLQRGEERMQALLLRVEHIPRNLLLFGWDVKRLSIQNFTWAPASLAQVMWPGHDEDLVDCTEDGLFGDFTIVSFPSISREAGSTMYGIVNLKDVTNRGPPKPSSEGLLVFSEGTGYFSLLITPYNDSSNIFSFNAFLFGIRRAPGEQLLNHEDGVAVVNITENTDKLVTCKYVTAGSLFWIEENKVEHVPVTAAMKVARVRVV